MINQKSLTDIYNKYNQEIFIHIFSFIRNKEQSEDILHDVFLRLIKYTQNHDFDETNIRAFLYKTARNLCIDYIRHNKIIEFRQLNEQLKDTKSVKITKEVEFNELTEKVNTLLKKQKPISRSVFYLKNESQKSYREIAEILQISERTAKRHMYKVIKYLADELEKSGFNYLNILFLSLF